jgi:hypothetical protein
LRLLIHPANGSALGRSGPIYSIPQVADDYFHRGAVTSNQLRFSTDDLVVVTAERVSPNSSQASFATSHASSA